jgi:hypothetical protein
MKKSEIAKYFARFGKKGGTATANKLSAAERSAAASKAAKARWKAKKKAAAS